MPNIIPKRGLKHVGRNTRDKQSTETDKNGDPSVVVTLKLSAREQYARDG